MPRRQPSKHDPIHDGHELGNACRNERQKSVLLREVGRINRQEVDKLISDSKGLLEASKIIVEESKKLCERAASAMDVKRKSVG